MKTNGLAELKIELTQECPLACIHCSTRSNRSTKRALPAGVVARLLREAHEMGARKVALTGGEPLVYKELHDILRTASLLGLATTLYTTGIKNNDLDPIDERDAASLMAAGLGRIIFSVYAASPRIHDSITGFASFGPTIEAARTCVQAGLRVEFHFVPLRRNHRLLREVFQLAESLGVPKVSVLRFVPQGRGATIRQTEDLAPEEYAELGSTIRELKTLDTVQVRLGAPMNMLGLGHTCCDAAQDILVIDHRGRIFPCDAFKGTDYPDLIFGSILQNSLASVWEKSAYLTAARNLHAERRNACGSCPTGCMAQEAARNGGLQQLVRLSDSKSEGDASKATNNLVELKAGSSG